MIRDGDTWIGDATDGHGYLDGIAAEGFDIDGKTALLVGAGGAGSAIAYEILSRGASQLALHDIATVPHDPLLDLQTQAIPAQTRLDAPPTHGPPHLATTT